MCTCISLNCSCILDHLCHFKLDLDCCRLCFCYQAHNWSDTLSRLKALSWRRQQDDTSGSDQGKHIISVLHSTNKRTFTHTCTRRAFEHIQPVYTRVHTLPVNNNLYGCVSCLDRCLPVALSDFKVTMDLNLLLMGLHCSHVNVSKTYSCF